MNLVRIGCLILQILMIPSIAHAQDENEEEDVRYIGHRKIVGPTINVEDVREFAEAGDAVMQHLMGTLSALGEPPDYVEAAKWYRRAAEAGEVESQVSLAELFMTGHKELVGSEEAMKWLRLAADAKHTRAFTMLGWLSLSESTDPKRLSVAELNFSRGIETGTQPKDFAPAYLGMAAVNEESNPAQAAKWMQQAAELGSSKAQFLLGELYRTGRGLPQNIGKAYFWYSLAAAYDQSSPNASRYRDEMAKSLSSDRVEVMQDLAAAWKPASSAEEARDRLRKSR